MKSLATTQFIIAIIAAIVFALPSLSLFSTVFGILIMLVVWGVGLYLLGACYKISSGTIPGEQSFGFWRLSFLFNLLGLLGALWYIAAAISTTNRAASWDLGGVLLGELFFVPAIAGTILGFMGGARANKLVDAGLGQ